MAFKRARCTRYENIKDQTGTDIAILIGGLLEDDSTTETRYGEYWIRGAEFASLPPVEPLVDGTPADARYRAILGILAGFVTRLYRQWEMELAARPQVVVKGAETLATLPVLTSLPGV